MKQILKRSFTLVLALALLLSLFGWESLLATPVYAAEASFPSSLYIRQATNVSCTRASNTMMLRARAYLSGNDNWINITEDDLTNCGAWSDAYGMVWNYSLNKASDGISVSVSSGRMRSAFSA